MSEIADVQWFIKAYFYQICDDRIEEKARKQQPNRASDPAPETSRGSTTTSGNEIRQEQPGARKTKPDSCPEIPATGHICSSSGSLKAPQVISPRPFFRPDCAQSAVVSTTKKRALSPPPPLFSVTSIPVASFPVRNPSIRTKGNVSRRTSRTLKVSTECLEWVLKALEAAMPCLLELLDNDPGKPDGRSKNLVLENEPPGFAGLALLDPNTQERLSYVVALRRQIRDPSDPRLVAHDTLTEATLKDALARIRKGK
ncbi:hypothetical protein FRC00_001115 [Tulasnella sp. 408]|nr:hypothetical protein FRC00_001115 [Tulasnella sp. 408]